MPNINRNKLCLEEGKNKLLKKIKEILERNNILYKDSTIANFLFDPIIDSNLNNNIYMEGVLDNVSNNNDQSNDFSDFIDLNENTKKNE